MAEEVVKSVTEELKCSICMNRFQVPKMLDCTHTFCERCLEDYVKKLNGEKVTCPMCRKICELPTGVKGLQTNIYLVNLCEKIDLYEKLKPSNASSKICESCKKSAKVTAFCIDCKSAICKNCEEQHAIFQALQSHSIEQIGTVDHEKLASIKRNTMIPSCDLHTPEKLLFYCKTCLQLICRECTVVQHPKPEHVCVEAPSQFEEDKKSLLQILRESSVEVQFVSVYLEKGKSGQNEITMESNALLKEVQDTYEKVKSEIEGQLDQQFKELQSAVQGTQANKISNIEESAKRATDWLERMKSTRKMTQKVLEENNVWELLELSKKLLSSFKALRDDKKDFQWDLSHLNLDLILMPSEIPTVQLGQCVSKSDPDTVICEHGSFMKFHLDRKKSVIEMARLYLRQDESNSFTEEKLTSLSIKYKISDCCSFSAAFNDSYAISGIDKWMLVVSLTSDSCDVFTFQGIDAPIASLALSEYYLFLVFSDKPNCIHYVKGVTHRLHQRNGEELDLVSTARHYPETIECYTMPHNVKHMCPNNKHFILITTENSETTLSYLKLSDRERYEINMKAPKSHEGLRNLYVLNCFKLCVESKRRRY